MTMVDNNQMTAGDAPEPGVLPQLLESARTNSDWKVDFATARSGQVVLMSVSPGTNPSNEIGAETHPFDQFILVVEGHGSAVLNGKEHTVQAGDLVLIPQGTLHNVVNADRNQAMKIVSFYSSNDIPANTVYRSKADEPHHD